MITPEYYILFAIFLFGGFVKGTLGIGLPTLLLGFLTFLYEPRMAVALILFAIMAANMRQAMIGGSMWVIVKKHKYFCVFASVGIFVVSIVGAQVPLPILLVSVGISMTIFALSSLFSFIPEISAKYDKVAQITAGIIGGILGGLTAIWGPPLAIYLMAHRMEKEQFIQTLGVMFSIQSVFLLAGFIVSGELTAPLAITGAALLVPTFIGMYLGEKLRKRMDTVQFTKVFLCVFLVLGLNLIRRGIWTG
ncbi:MAG: sulfite exporter TauE/SafE family protein [Amylibacter sp.]|nr:sulfite exporter TauE/SafE family protein [Amylibacter sp.]